MARPRKDDTPAGGWLGPGSPGGGRNDLPAHERKVVHVANGSGARGWKWKPVL